MKRYGWLVLTVFLLACTPIEQNARDTAAALSGALVSAQDKYLETCKVNPADRECSVINQAIAGQNALVTAIEAYCGWSITNPPADPNNTPCVPVKSVEAGLRTATNNATLFITELRGLVKQ